MENFFVSTDKSLLDIRVIHGFLTGSYWAANIPEQVVIKAIENSLCFGVYNNKQQVGFARVVTDYAVFAYLADVFILEEFRGKGLSKMLMQEIMNHPHLQNLRRWMLGTRDAHGLYSQFGFKPVSLPERIMEIFIPDIYNKTNNDKSK